MGEVLTVFRRKNVKPQSMATEKHKFQRPVLIPVNQKSGDFSDDLRILAQYALGVAVQVIIVQCIHANAPPQLRISMDQVYLETCTYEQIVSYLKQELALIGLGAPDKLQVNTVTQQVKKLQN